MQCMTPFPFQKKEYLMLWTRKYLLLEKKMHTVLSNVIYIWANMVFLDHETPLFSICVHSQSSSEAG